jgi:hypothetical protein
MTEDPVEARRARSAALFNNSHVAEVVLQIAALTRHDAGEFVTTRKIAARTGLADSLVRPVVLRLEAAELLDRLPRLGGSRSEQFFTRATSNQWTKLVQLCRALSIEQERACASARSTREAPRPAASGGTSEPRT